MAPWQSVWACGGHGGLGTLTVLASSTAGPALGLLLARGGLVARPSPGRYRGGGGLRGGTLGLLGGTTGVVFPEVLVEDGLKGETLAADVAVEGLVSGVLADVVLQLVLPGVLLPTDAADERRDTHVQAHVAVQAALLVEGLAAVDAGEPGVVAEPTVPDLLPQVVLVAAHVKRRVLLPLRQKQVLAQPTNPLSVRGLLFNLSRGRRAG